MAYKLTFIGDKAALKAGAWQKHFAPEWRKGLLPGDSVTVETIPHNRIHGAPEQFLVDGKPYLPPAKAAEKPKPKATKEG